MGLEKELPRPSQITSPGVCETFLRQFELLWKCPLVSQFS
jgi:hypothetical protein